MSDSPIEQLLGAIERLDVDAVIALLSADARFLTADGRRAQGTDALHDLLSAFLAELRSIAYRITSQWHVDDVWIAEVDASYELRDWLQLSGLPRAFVVRQGAKGIADVRVYGAHEHLLSDHGTGQEGMPVGARWIPPL